MYQISLCILEKVPVRGKGFKFLKKVPGCIVVLKNCFVFFFKVLSGGVHKVFQNIGVIVLEKSMDS